MIVTSYRGWRPHILIFFSFPSIIAIASLVLSPLFFLFSLDSLVATIEALPPSILGFYMHSPLPVSPLPPSRTFSCTPLSNASSLVPSWAPSSTHITPPIMVLALPTWPNPLEPYLPSPVTPLHGLTCRSPPFPRRSLPPPWLDLLEPSLSSPVTPCIVARGPLSTPGLWCIPPPSVGLSRAPSSAPLHNLLTVHPPSLCRSISSSFKCFHL